MNYEQGHLRTFFTHHSTSYLLGCGHFVNKQVIHIYLMDLLTANSDCYTQKQVKNEIRQSLGLKLNGNPVTDSIVKMLFD